MYTSIMETIYFEKQEGLLCAQHCLNALLQGQYFNPLDLAKIAKDLDDEEKQRMGESGVDTVEYRNFIQQPSGNMDDTGYFSVQVISRCLSIWGLDLVRFGSTDQIAVEAQNSPERMNAYICNYKDHWFTVRKLGNQWFNLNSVSKGPKLISDTFLSLFLTQLQQEGYSIFIVLGELPHCEADSVLRYQTVKEGAIAPPSSPNPTNDGQSTDIAMESSEEHELARALQLSLRENQIGIDDDLDVDLDRAIKLSLSSAQGSSGLSNDSQKEEKMDQGAVGGFEDMDSELEAAMKLSLECIDQSQPPCT